MRIIFLFASLMFLNSFSMELLPSTTKLRLVTIVNSEDLSESECIAEIESLIEKGCDLNVNIFAGFTALHYAVFRKKKAVCKFLIDKGANPHIENCDDTTALTFAEKRCFYFGCNSSYDKELFEILKSSPCTIFRPGMNRDDHHYGDKKLVLKTYNRALKQYNKKYSLNLTLGDSFEPLEFTRSKK